MWDENLIRDRADFFFFLFSPLTSQTSNILPGLVTVGREYSVSNNIEIMHVLISDICGMMQLPIWHSSMCSIRFSFSLL